MGLFAALVSTPPASDLACLGVAFPVRSTSEASLASSGDEVSSFFLLGTKPLLNERLTLTR